MEMAIVGPISFDIIQMRYAKKSCPTPPAFHMILYFNKGGLHETNKLHSLIPPAKGIVNHCVWRAFNAFIKSYSNTRKSPDNDGAKAMTTSWATIADCKSSKIKTAYT